MEEVKMVNHVAKEVFQKLLLSFEGKFSNSVFGCCFVYIIQSFLDKI